MLPLPLLLLLLLSKRIQEPMNTTSDSTFDLSMTARSFRALTSPYDHTMQHGKACSMTIAIV
jgi:hypothetical protein